jgi:hypothetical protein
MPTLQDLYEHKPDPRIDKVRGYYDKASKLAEALYSGFLRSIPQPEGAGVEWDGEAGQYTGYSQRPEETAYNTLSWLVPTGGIGEAVDFARNGLRPGTVKAITAYHGSPHQFDQFDMSKIGTGEGAQAYGHGLYFAESPDVAESYAETLGKIKPAVYSVDGVPFSESDAMGWRGTYLEAARNSSLDQNISSLENALKQVQDNDLINELEFAKSLQGKKISLEEMPQRGGVLYKTSLEWPDPAREAADPLGPQHFLDWDRPLSENMNGVKNALSDEHLYNFGIDSAGNDAYTGKALSVADFANFMKNQYGDNGSAKLAASGIPGIRYLDQGSRGAGGGTYNYVVFDDKIPKIVERNGVTLEDLLRR